MPVYIDSIRFQDEYTGLLSGNGTDLGIDQLMGCVGDMMWAELSFNVSWFILDANMTFRSSAKSITLNNCNQASSIISDNQFASSFGNSFLRAGFKAGDTIVIAGTTMGVDDGTYTIATITDTVITVLEAVPGDGAFAGVNCYGATNINALDFYYNIVPSNQAAGNTKFNSLTDVNSVQKFTGLTSPLYYGNTYSLFPNATSQAWWNDEVRVNIPNIICQPLVTSYGITADYKQEFTMVFPFLITPFFLSDQLSMLQAANGQTEASNTGVLNGTNGFTQPNYFTQGLGFICQIDARYNVVSSAPDQSSAGTTFKPGNTTWFDTFFATGVYLGGSFLNSVQYTSDSVSYTDASANPITAVAVGAVTNVKLKIGYGSPVTTGPFVLNFMWLPTNPGEYQNYSSANQANFREVFLHDRCKTSVGASSKNGDQFGNATQAITNVTTSAYANGFEIDFQIDMGTQTELVLQNADPGNRNYLIWVTPQSPLSTALDNTDRTAVICDVNLATYSTDDATLLTANTVFYQYPETYTNGTVDFSAYAGQYGLASTNFSVKTGCSVTSMANDFIVEVYDTVTGAVTGTFPVQSWGNSTAAFYDGTESQISVSVASGLDLPAGTYGARSVQRAPQYDTPTTYSIITLLPFQIGYQYWYSLPAFDPMFQGYHTQYWPVYTQGYAQNNPRTTVWHGTLRSRIRYRQTWNVLDPSTGVTTQFLQYSNIFAYDEGKNPAGSDAVVYTSDVYGNSLGGVVASDTPTTITVVYDNLPVPPAGSTTIGSVTVSYNTGNTMVYDTITTLDLVPETPASLWNVPLLISDAPGLTVLIGTINLQALGVAATQVTITSNISYQLSTNLVTDAGVDIVTDGGVNIVVD